MPKLLHFHSAFNAFNQAERNFLARPFPGLQPVRGIRHGSHLLDAFDVSIRYSPVILSFMWRGPRSAQIATSVENDKFSNLEGHDIPAMFSPAMKSSMLLIALFEAIEIKMICGRKMHLQPE